MNKIIFCVFSFLTASTAFSQTYTVKGTIVTTQKQAVEFADVALLENENVLYETYTDSLGGFEFHVEQPQTYALLLDYFGTEQLRKEINVAGDMDLGTIEIKGDETLDELVIESRKKLMERKIDRLVFNVENSISASSGNLLDALKVTPGIQVSNNTISIVGKSSVSVMIEDKIVQLSGESLINFLQSISADEIKNIEVITTPPAKYEAEGNSGLINIKYKSVEKNSWNNSIRTSYAQTTYPSISVGNTFRYNKNKLSFIASLDAKKGDTGGKNTKNIEYPDQLWVGKEHNKYRKDNYTGRFNVDYQLSEKSNIGAVALFNQSNPDIFTESNFNVTNNQQLLKNIHTRGNIYEVDKNLSFNLNFNQTLDTIGRKFSVNIDYFNYKEDKNSIFNTKETDNSTLLTQQTIADNNGNINIQNFSGKVDFEHPTNWAKISYGIKTTFTKTNSDITLYDLSPGTPILDLNQSNKFEYSENIQALYFDIAKSIDKKFQFQLGLRYEFTQTKGFSLNEDKESKTNYHRLFPTVHTLYLINDSQFLNFNYSRRINRPAFWELNPFRWYVNSYSYAEGNPFLQPSYSDNFEFTYGYNQKWFSTLFAQVNSNGFGQVPLVDQDDYHQIFIRDNYFKVVGFGLAQSYTFNYFHWLESNFQASGFYTKTTVFDKFKDQLPSQNGLGMNFSTYNSIIFNKEKTLIGEINYSFTSSNNSIIYQRGSSGSLNVGLRMLFLNKNLQVSVNVYDVLKTNNPDLVTYTNGIKQVFNNYYDSRFLNFSLRYNFGNKKINVSEKKFGNESERDRIK